MFKIYFALLEIMSRDEIEELLRMRRPEYVLDSSSVVGEFSCTRSGFSDLRMGFAQVFASCSDPVFASFSRGPSRCVSFSYPI